MIERFELGPTKTRRKIVSNQVAANNGGQGRGNQGNQARGRAFMLGAEEARQDPNIMTASGGGQLVEIVDKPLLKVFAKLEIEGHVFDIDLIPFGHRSFDVIIERLKQLTVKNRYPLSRIVEPILISTERVVVFLEDIDLSSGSPSEWICE
ncbi:hypothetical protein Tco_1093025 [Tanacetum coccineum]|uniref:Uncharacterized protein n=1 Tax=Tanacetum coccineum TaxID=301880 RepID=A0ABQ5IDY9_9ASTR